MSATEAKFMQCMEVWGGNRPVDSGVIMPGLDAWLFSQPQGSDEGGDVHYVSSCAAGMITRMLVADVAGHGQTVAATATRLRQLMRRYIVHHDQIRFVRAMNEEFTTLTESGRFATAVVMTFDATTNRLLLANAGHPPPLHFRAADRTWSYLSPSSAELMGQNVPLGIEASTDYQQADLRLKVGDLVLCYTDSLPEACDAAGNMLGYDGLLDMARGIDCSEPSAFVRALFEAISRRTGGKIIDDLTLLLFRPNGLRPRVPIRDHVLAPLRVIKALATGYFFSA